MYIYVYLYIFILFWKILQNSQENTCNGVSFLIKFLLGGLLLQRAASENRSIKSNNTIRNL